jgi:predicted O-linked N-acetylglucosamine transferase (SPINDLY family)
VTGLTTRQLGEQIRQLGIDILIDLHGHTTGHRLDVMALKPAPVQLTWLGFLGTTGLSTIDYVLADRVSVPESAEGEFTEQVWRLPHYYCFDEPDIALPVAPPPMLRNGFITFGSFNKPNKLNDRVLALWSQLLRDIPGSRLLIKGKGLNVPEFRQQFQRRLLIQGFDLDRVILEGPAPRQQFLATYQHIDIALDTFPYAGATTIVEALWCGVPVLSLKGDRMVWRMAESILSQAGFSQWVAPGEAQFIALARTLAADPAGLASQRQQQRQQLLQSPLFDRVRYAEDLADALRGMWRAYCR